MLPEGSDVLTALYAVQDDVAVIVEAVKHKASIPEGYTMILESLCS